VNVAESELELKEESSGILELPFNAADRSQPDLEVGVIAAALALDKSYRRPAASIGGKPCINVEPIVHRPGYEKRRMVIADTQLDIGLQAQMFDDLPEIEMGADKDRIRVVRQSDPQAPVADLEPALRLLRRLSQYGAAKEK